MARDTIELSTSPRNYIWDFALSKLYSNSLLSTLNARGGWKATGALQENVLFGHTSGSETTTFQVWRHLPWLFVE
jgi:hypothetical protein